jgi:hypothetical protein
MATSPRPYKNQQTKNLQSNNPHIKPKSLVRSSELEGERLERAKRWITFFRRNPNYLIRDYFEITLHPYQMLMIWVLQRSTLAYIVAARAASKTFIIAIWSLCLAVLYPGIKIITVSKTLKQGGLIVGKIDELRKKHPNVFREIDDLTYNTNGAEIKFHCGSHILAVPASESARGNRANYVIIEESRLVPKEVLESIIKPFLEIRTPPYMLKEEYKNISELKEEGIISYITSAWYTAEYWFTYVKSCIKRMIRGDETANFLAFDYLITIKHNIKTQKMIDDEWADADETTIQMEYKNIPSGSSGKAYYPLKLFTRTMKKAFYPQDEFTYNSKKNKWDIPKEEEEIRFITMDVAIRANKVNDNSIIGCVRLIPRVGIGYERQLVYMESFKGTHVGVQAQRMKEIYHDFSADYICLDASPPGIGVFDSLSETTYCENRDITYPAFTVVDENFGIVKQEAREDLRNNHTRGVNPIPNIFPITASLELNSQIASKFKIALQKKLWRFLIADGDAEGYLLKSYPEFDKNLDDSEMYAKLMNPYVQTGLFISECINLDFKPMGDKIKLDNKAGCYKDRFSAVSYVNYVVSTEFDHQLLKEIGEEQSEWDYIAAITNVL